MNNYFSHDSNARNSEKLINVRMKYGAEGYGIYFMILERLREEHDYMSIKDYNVIAFDLHVDASKIKSIVEDFGLFVFTEDGEYFYSSGFNKRMALKDEKANRRKEASKKAANKRWGKKDKPTKNQDNANAMPTHNDSNANAMPNDAKEKESKEKESKGNKSKVSNTSPTSPKFEPEDLTLEFLDFWNVYPRQEKKQKAFNEYVFVRNSGISKDLLVKKASEYAKSLKLHGSTGGYVSMPENWLKEQRWTDEYDLTPVSNGTDTDEPQTREDWVR
ncbi:hypothetical protein IWT25_00720 [Secundilactobacillus pentosiphilus]|uniref:Lin1244/Lin1753-like N-terminal domain-containing protein n=1 Tax=Secundilactobacillus pentosiphilus TaxID=1714682 RepID=A0A1Z5IUQ8_9LACO|nr:DUF4373 domain-containing protein [Secundilactobacillus pentosiphilus]GAX05416.1 hypothetical protein IWT25_00720 [Secundilactobacillus pentosiphilus]